MQPHKYSLHNSSRLVALFPGCEALEGGYEYNSESAKKNSETVWDRAMSEPEGLQRRFAVTHGVAEIDKQLHY